MNHSLAIVSNAPSRMRDGTPNSDFAKVEGFDDHDAAQLLVEDFTDAQNGMRRIIALGLNCFQLKEEKLKHGQFGPWLKQFAPQLCREDADSAKPSSSLSTYMKLTESALDSIGFQIGEFLQIPSALGISRAGDFLMLPDEKLNKKQLTARNQLFSVIDGKTQRQLLLQFKNEKKRDGGFRPPDKAVQAWLKEHHPELAGTKYADLPEKIQKAFKKQYRPALPEEITNEARRAQAMLAAKDFAAVFDDGLYADCTEAERRELLAICKDATKLLEGSLKK